MTFTYSGDPSTSQLDEVRFLVGDTDSSAVMLQDAEVTWLLSTATSTTAAAAEAADACAAWCNRQADEVDKKVGDTSISRTWRNRVDGYIALAERLRAKAGTNAPTPWAHPDALAAGFTVGAMDRTV